MLHWLSRQEFEFVNILNILVFLFRCLIKSSRMCSDVHLLIFNNSTFSPSCIILLIILCIIFNIIISLALYFLHLKFYLTYHNLSLNKIKIFLFHFSYKVCVVKQLRIWQIFMGDEVFTAKSQKYHHLTQRHKYKIEETYFYTYLIILYCII